MRASAPSWFVLVFLVVKGLQENLSLKYIRFVFISVIILSSLRYIFIGQHIHRKIPGLSIAGSKPLTQLYEQKWFNTQYFGRMDSFYFKYISK
jgi:hypothetical protein